MASPTLIEYYQRGVPHPKAKPFKQDGEWTTGSTPDITVDPQTDEMMIIDAIDLRVPRDLDLNSSNLEIQGYEDGAGGTKLVFADLNDILQQCDEVIHDDTVPTTNELKLRFKAKPGIKLTHTGTETLVFHNSVAVDHTFTGWIRFAVHGWFLSETDW